MTRASISRWFQVSKTSLDHRTTSAFAYLEIAPSGTGDVRPGDTVHTISNPLGLGLAVSTGIISATDRVVERYTLPCLMSTADISQGSSGGALMNALGQVIGVTSGAYTYGNSMYLAVPIDPVLSADLTVQGWTLKEVKERNPRPPDRFHSGNKKDTLRRVRRVSFLFFISVAEDELLQILHSLHHCYGTGGLQLTGLTVPAHLQAHAVDAALPGCPARRTSGHPPSARGACRHP